MSITDVIERRRKLSDKKIRGVMREYAVHFSRIDDNLSQTIQPLVEYVLDLAKRRKDTYVLSNFYPQELQTRDGKHMRNYEVSYEADEDGISIVAFDPNSDTIDPGESYVGQIPKQEFLTWVMGNRVHMIDVYQHIQIALRQKKDAGEAHRRHLENYF